MKNKKKYFAIGNVVEFDKRLYIVIKNDVTINIIPINSSNVIINISSNREKKIFIREYDSFEDDYIEKPFVDTHIDNVNFVASNIQEYLTNKITDFLFKKDK